MRRCDAYMLIWFRCRGHYSCKGEKLAKHLTTIFDVDIWDKYVLDRVDKDRCGEVFADLASIMVVTNFVLSFMPRRVLGWIWD